MGQLEEKRQLEIDSLREKANDYWDQDKRKYFNTILEAWNLYPDPKNNWHEAYSLAKEIFSAYMEEKNFDLAKEWLNQMIDNNNNLHHSYEDCLFNSGKYRFCVKQFDEALANFKEVVKSAGYRYFDDEDPIYLDFYKNSQKYMKAQI